MAVKKSNYRGMNYTVQRGGGLVVYQGYAEGLRVVYALSKAEFERKADAFLRGKRTKEQKRTLSLAPMINSYFGR